MSEAQQKILYVEDNPDNQRLVQRIMGARGYLVLIAEDGPEGVALARETLPTIVLVDLGIPGLDGYETTTRLRSMPHLRDVPIVALTADSSPGARERALVAGCDGYIVKPIDARQLPQLVAEFIDGRRDKVAAPAVEVDLLRAYSQRLVERLELRVRELSAANAELQELDRLKGQFLSSLSHELRTPLTALMGYLELFDRGMLGELSEPQRDAVVVMRRSSETLAQQLNNLLYFQELRGRALNLRALRPTEALRPLMAAMQERARAQGLAFDIQAGDALPMLADGEAFEQLARSLLDNALKFTARGGRVRLTVHDEPSRLILRIEDTGQGIEKEHLQKIFLPFYRVETPQAFIQPGSGLGLAIARHIVEAHGGQITVRSTPGRGSTFTVVLPRTSAP
ncbi:MAG: hybrid sensor histidine kinase/response regulator [Chloroflexales bacterium]|nr:hybrid sensor histidine kinase/response regulator [Chloroflexales bacterium]